MSDADDRPRYGERVDPADLMPARVEGRPAPGYGEYAPAGWVSPVAPVEEPEAPTTETDVVQDARRGGPVGTETRRPQVPRTFDAPPPTGAPVPGRPPSAVRNASFNRFATMILLAYGLYDVIRGALQTSAFVQTYVSEFTSLGYLRGDFHNGAALHSVAVISAVASVAVYLLVAIWAIRRLRAGKRSWVVLLVTGIVVNLATGVCVVAVVMNDPSFVGIASAPL
ncbi:hypothetical protein GCM10025867_19050 [Frondihabitans sucicola]|uniref:Uncharacterized protein n=1 Tax=Frondihabitans sucicola TaxID=1268041 RepID=A0ABM8GMN2_9MICO|nr:DUF6264 family protein [Frondihabitans sucicola]BDZ49664.1 hypothetical protein GCM10025867_19050 [Frondihabitans sucicola]